MILSDKPLLYSGTIRERDIVKEMEYTSFVLIMSIMTFFYVITTKSGWWKSGNITRLPPGPYPLPIIGNIFKLGESPHLSLTLVHLCHLNWVPSPPLLYHHLNMPERSFRNTTYPSREGQFLTLDGWSTTIYSPWLGCRLEITGVC